MSLDTSILVYSILDRLDVVKFFIGKWCYVFVVRRGPRHATVTDISKVRDNFNRIARDLDRAVRIAGFSTVERYLFDEARELCWSFSGEQARPFRFRFSELGRRGPFHRVNLSRACGVMIACKVFAVVTGPDLLINKRYPEWLTEGGDPRFTKVQLEWCQEIVKRGRNCSRTATAPVAAALQDCSRTATPDVAPPITPVEERAAEERELGENTHIRGHAPGCARDENAPQIRPPDDLAKVNEAIALLGRDLRTEHLGLELGRSHSLPGLMDVAGWQWLEAAKVATGPSVNTSKRKSFAYFAAVARNACPPEERGPRRNGKPEPEPEYLPPAERKRSRRAAAEPKGGGD